MASQFRALHEGLDKKSVVAHNSDFSLTLTQQGYQDHCRGGGFAHARKPRFRYFFPCPFWPQTTSFFVVATDDQGEMECEKWKAKMSWSGWFCRTEGIMLQEHGHSGGP